MISSSLDKKQLKQLRQKFIFFLQKHYMVNLQTKKQKYQAGNLFSFLVKSNRLGFIKEFITFFIRVYDGNKRIVCDINKLYYFIVDNDLNINIVKGYYLFVEKSQVDQVNPFPFIEMIDHLLIKLNDFSKGSYSAAILLNAYYEVILRKIDTFPNKQSFIKQPKALLSAYGYSLFLDYTEDSYDRLDFLKLGVSTKKTKQMENVEKERREILKAINEIKTNFLLEGKIEEEAEINELIEKEGIIKAYALFTGA